METPTRRGERDTTPGAVVEHCAPLPPNKATTPRAFLGIDLVFAISATILLGVLFSVVLAQFSAARQDTDARRALRLVIETELRRIRAGEIEDAATRRADDPARDAQLTTTIVPATGVWVGFDRVRVVGRKPVSGGRWVEVELSAYVPQTGGAP